MSVSRTDLNKFVWPVRYFTDCSITSKRYGGYVSVCLSVSVSDCVCVIRKSETGCACFKAYNFFFFFNCQLLLICFLIGHRDPSDQDHDHRTACICLTQISPIKIPAPRRLQLFFSPLTISPSKPSWKVNLCPPNVAEAFNRRQSCGDVAEHRVKIRPTQPWWCRTHGEGAAENKLQLTLQVGTNARLNLFAPGVFVKGLPSLVWSPNLGGGGIRGRD